MLGAVATHNYGSPFRIPQSSILINLEAGANDLLPARLQMEVEFAAECGRNFLDELNPHKLNPKDFLEKDSDVLPEKIEELRKVIGILYYGLATGYSFNFLVSNIDSLSESLKTGITSSALIAFDDPIELKSARGSRLIARCTADFETAAFNFVCQLAKDDFGSISDPILKSVCYSVLASFLCNRAIQIKPENIKEIEAGVSPEQVYMAVNSPKRPQNLPAALNFKDLSHFENWQPLAVIDNQELCAKMRKFLLLVEKFTASVLSPDKKILAEFLPSQADKEQAVDLLLNNGKLKKLYLRATELLQEAFTANTPHGFPDHDMRHVLFAVPSTALALSKNRDTYTQIFGCFCALMHDAGRILESRFAFGTAQQKEFDKNHPAMSTIIAANLLDEFPELPRRVRYEVLASIALHDTGKAQNSELALFTQSADRLQLLGPEFFTRIFGYTVACHNLPIYPHSKTDSCDRKSVLGSVAFYLHNIYPNISNNSSLEFRLTACSGAIISLATYDNNYRDILFEAPFSPNNGWNVLPHAVMRSIQREAFRATCGGSYAFAEYPEVESRLPELSSYEYLERLWSLPLTTHPVSIFADGSGVHNVKSHLAKASTISEYFNRALRYACIIGELYNSELEQNLHDAAHGHFGQALAEFAEPLLANYKKS